MAKSKPPAQPGAQQTGKQDAPEREGVVPSPLATGRALILLQLVSRLLTFVLNQGLLRAVPPSVLGTASIQFDLVSSTILFLSREGVRNALLRSHTPLTASERRLASLPLYLGLAVAALTSGLYVYTSPASTTSQKGFYPALALYVAGALLELGVEKWYISTIRSGKLKVRVAAEGGQAAVRAAVSFALVVLGWPLVGMAVGYFCGSAWLAGTYVVNGIAEDKSDQDEDQTKVDDTRALAFANTRQSVVKHVLTEADRIAVGRISPLNEQGGYAVATNYGSLVARIIFQPVEETLLVHWSRTLDSPATAEILIFALRSSLYLGLVLVVFLPPLLPAVLPLLLPRKYIRETTAARTLQTYLVTYLPLLSLNGILEAFHAASATPAQVALQAKVMIASSGVFALALYLLAQRAGSYTTEQALIYASCVAMAVRVVYAFSHARRVAGSLSGILPKMGVVGALAVFGSVVWASSERLGASTKDQLTLLALGAGCGINVLGIIYIKEKGDARRLSAMLGRG